MSIISCFLMPHPPLIIPDIGKGEEKKIQNTIDSMDKIGMLIAEYSPETIVVITPHGNLFRDAISVNYDKLLIGDFGSFRYGNISQEYINDREFADAIVEEASDNNIPAVLVDYKLKKKYMLDSRLDHGVLVPLHFVTKYYKSFDLIHVTYGLLSNMDLYGFGQVIQKTSHKLNRKVVVIASGDLSHRLTRNAPSGFSETGPIFDQLIMKYLKDDNRIGIMTMDGKVSEKAGECGLRSIQIMIGSLDGLGTKNRVFSYEGPFGVGYGCVELAVTGNQSDRGLLQEINRKNNAIKAEVREKEDEYVRLARKTLETYVTSNKRITPDENVQDKVLMTEKAGVFVSLKKNGELRGCIGTIEPTKNNIAEEIITNAISAGIYDPRFKPIDVDELDQLIYSVDILMKPEKIRTKDMLNPQEYGVIVSKGHKKGLLLPNLEGVDTVDEQLRIALRKAGINSWEDYEMERFRVVRHH
ncbi:MAG: AmmeMemoRadiSam system protein A [Eubacteriales bacterium]|nr:AmmeMemoRadiSam system protein A [Eubacteriales bacterium]